MKMFMEINPQLFDDCSHEYAELQNSAEARERNRQQKWDALSQMAKARKNKPALGSPSGTQPRTISDGLPNSENIDPLAHENQQRLHALKLEDETNSAGKDRRLRERDGQNSVSASPIG
jgi:serine/threonine-protein phosphatase 2A regulatory subunit B'